MYLIELSDKEIKRRSSEIRILLGILLTKEETAKRGEKTTISCNTYPQAQHYILGTYDGSIPNKSYRDWRFTCYNTEFRCMYFEDWVPSDLAKTKWALNNLSFSLFRVLRQSRDEREVLAIHCEPRETEPADKTIKSHYQYKRIPHLHVSLATQPLPHSHFALHHTNDISMMKNIESLTSFMRNVLVMIKDEVIDTNDKEWKINT
ncbi:hypothetical protein [Hymenobacter sp. BT491]|uniref:hypothetical protein n=1 Tax=Hymenobacter sp. BT491 TaxID=2766779 RepID=UPI001653E888|nr:hypothetical protein [Hymenobacter sp. BT491]MBC6992222.1 hypothetical protein [Hymenobacter sp. BT491]